MKNSNENLMGGTWLLTFLLHQNALFYYSGLCVNSATFAFILTCHKQPGRNPVLIVLIRSQNSVFTTYLQDRLQYSTVQYNTKKFYL